MSTTAYEELLNKTRSAAQLEAWLESNQGGNKSSVWERNLWGLAMLAAAALHYFFREILRVNIDAINASGENAGAQAALDLMPPQPASAQDLTRAVYAFLETRRMEQDDTGRPPQAQPREGSDEDVPPAAVSSALHQAQPERRLPVELIATWTDSERLAAFRWADHVMAGGQAPPPEVLAKTYMEDLRLTEAQDRVTLLEWVGIGHPESADHWGEGLWTEVLAWAKAVHRKDRGEAEVEIPQTPAIFLPARDLFDSVKTFVFDSGPRREEVISLFGMEHPGTGIALDALVALGEIALDLAAPASFGTTERNLRADPAELMAAAEAIAHRAELPKPKRRKPAPAPFFTYRVMTTAPLGGEHWDDVALRYSHPDQRPEHLTGIALIHRSEKRGSREHFPGVIDYGELTWKADPELIATYRGLLVEELEEAVEQAKAEKNILDGEPHVSDEDIAAEPENGKQRRLRAVKEG